MFYLVTGSVLSHCLSRGAYQELRRAFLFVFLVLAEAVCQVARRKESILCYTVDDSTATGVVQRKMIWTEILNRGEEGMGDRLRIAGVVDESIVDGPGIRYVVFVQGCPHRCEGCHNEQTHDFDGGTEVDASALLAEIDRDPMITGVTFSGGEPFCQAEALAGLAEAVKARGKDLMVYSGYTFEELSGLAERDRWVKALLEAADRLVDGRYIKEERDLELAFRGSRNQRYIDLRATRDEGRIVLVDEQIYV